jgi:hypothetical protein
MSSSICSRCLCRRTWDLSRYRTCNDCRQRRQMHRTPQRDPTISVTIPSSTISNHTELISSPNPSQPLYQTHDKSQQSSTKRRRLKSNISDPSKLFLGPLSFRSINNFDSIRFDFESSVQSFNIA